MCSTGTHKYTHTLSMVVPAGLRTHTYKQTSLSQLIPAADATHLYETDGACVCKLRSVSADVFTTTVLVLHKEMHAVVEKIWICCTDVLQTRT